MAAIFFPDARLDLFFLSFIKKNVAPEMLSLYICVGRSSVPVSLSADLLLGNILAQYVTCMWSNEKQEFDLIALFV
jgi:hypothetical protein